MFSKVEGERACIDVSHELKTVGPLVAILLSLSVNRFSLFGERVSNVKTGHSILCDFSDGIGDFYSMQMLRTGHGLNLAGSMWRWPANEIGEFQGRLEGFLTLIGVNSLGARFSL